MYSQKTLEVFPQQIAPHALKVVLEQLRQLDDLLLGQVFRPLQQTPLRLLQHRLVAVLSQPPGLAAANLVDRFAHLCELAHAEIAALLKRRR